MISVACVACRADFLDQSSARLNCQLLRVRHGPRSAPRCCRRSCPNPALSQGCNPTWISVSTFACVCRVVAMPLQIRKAPQQDIQLACWYGAPFSRKSASLANGVVVKKCEEVRATRLFLEEKRKPNASILSRDASVPFIDVAFEKPWGDILAERAFLRRRRVA